MMWILRQVEDVLAVHQARVRQRWEREHGLIQRGPALEDARVIVEFARRVRDVEGAVLCHCGGGISRGPAVAILCLAAWMGAGSEVACVKRFCAADRPRSLMGI